MSAGSSCDRSHATAIGVTLCSPNTVYRRLGTAERSRGEVGTGRDSTEPHHRDLISPCHWLSVPRAGFEPAAYPLGGDRSIQLSYRGRAGIVAYGREACVNWLDVRATFASWPGRIGCMRTLEAVNMSPARSSVLHMSKMIQ